MKIVFFRWNFPESRRKGLFFGLGLESFIILAVLNTPIFFVFFFLSAKIVPPINYIWFAASHFAPTNADEHAFFQ